MQIHAKLVQGKSPHGCDQEYYSSPAVLSDNRPPGLKVILVFLRKTDLAVRFNQDGKRLKGGEQRLPRVVGLDGQPAQLRNGFADGQHSGKGTVTVSDRLPPDDDQAGWQINVILFLEISSVDNRRGSGIQLPGIQRLAPSVVPDVH